MARNRGLVAAMEEELALLEPEAEAVDPALLVEDGENMETSVGEVVEAGGEVDGQLDSIDTGLDAADELEAHTEIMEDSIETGGMDETAAQVMEVAIESIRNRLKMKKKVVMPAMESFGAKGDRVAATKLAMEAASDVLKTVWAAIVNACKRMSGFIASIVDKILKGAEHTKERIEALKTSVKGIEGRSPTEAKVPAGSFGAGLTTKAGASYSGIESAYKTLAKAVASGKGAVDSAIEAIKTSADFEKAVADKEAFDNFPNANRKLEGFTESNEYGAAPEGCAFAVSAELPGGVRFVQTFTTEAASKGQAALLGYSSAKLEIKAIKGGVAEVKELDTLGTSEMDTLLITATDLVTAMIAAKSNLAGLVAARKDFDATIDKVANVIDSEGNESPDAESVKRAAVIKKAIAGMNSYAAGSVKEINAYGLTTTKKVLDYVGASVKAHAAKVEDKAAKPVEKIKAEEV